MNIYELAKTISNMVKEGDYVLGHSIFEGRGVASDIKDKILKNGLRIEDAHAGIKFTMREFEPVYDDCLENLNDLAKNSSGIVFIIAIPHELLVGFESKYFSSHDSSSILLHQTEEVSEFYKDVYGNPTRVAILPKEYVLGYLNVKENLFVKNNEYGFNNLNKRIHNLKLMLDKKYEEIKSNY